MPTELDDVGHPDRVPMYQIDAFASRPFAGNPAAVVVTDRPLSAALMQAVAAENNLSETAFVVPRGADAYDLRWFTPTLEVDLCGHATLGAAAALVYRGDVRDAVRFTASGVLTVRVDGERLVMDFPAVPVLGTCDDRAIADALGTPCELFEVRRVHGRRYVLARVADEGAVRAASPDIGALRALGVNVIVTAPGRDVDVVSRFFAPASGVDEDPVTGSAHCTLAPFWAERLGRDALACRQLSARGGDVDVAVRGDRVELGGRWVLVLEGTLILQR